MYVIKLYQYLYTDDTGEVIIGAVKKRNEALAARDTLNARHFYSIGDELFYDFEEVQMFENAVNLVKYHERED